MDKFGKDIGYDKLTGKEPGTQPWTGLTRQPQQVTTPGYRSRQHDTTHPEGSPPDMNKGIRK